VRVWDGGERSPVVIGLVGGGALALLSITLTVAFGWAPSSPFELRFWGDPRGWFDVVLSGLFGWSLGSGVALVRGAREDMAAIRPALRETAALPEIDSLPRRSLLRAALGAVVLGIAINFTPQNWPDGFPGLSDGFFLWATLRTILVAWALCRTGLIAGTLARRFSRLGPMLRFDDLLDLRPLAPLGRCALRNVAVWVGVSAFFALMLIAPFGRQVATLSIVASAGVAVLAFVGPVRGARQRLVEARAAELGAVRAAIRARLGGDEAPIHRFRGLALADLLAWEQRVEHVRTWPFDASTLLRFALYAAIGLGSWVGAALVERALGAAFE